MAGAEVNVAIVALIISLIALFVTTQQLLVQIFGSADGYRQCAESVIGSWHKKRKRVWKWSEFRFETQYVTPQIVIFTPNEFHVYGKEYGDVYRINSKNLGDPGCKELDSTIHELHRRNQVKGSAGTSVKTQNQLEKGLTGLPSQTFSAVRQRIGVRSDTLVTWLRMLRELHALTHSYWPNDCSSCPGLTEPEVSDTKVALEVGTDSNLSWALDRSSNVSRTEVGIIYRTWNWGFMPPDLTRPLAEVSMGDIVILALRMGMQWRVLDLDSGKLQADGNGFNLTGFEARGLGIILRLTATEHHSEYRKLIPTRAVDKMLLGILPGDPQLVGRDFPLVTKDFNVQPLAHPQGILASIMSVGNRETMERLDFVEVRIDVITLLLTYLPLDGSTMTRYCFPGWNTEPAYRSVYCFWEGRLALHRALRKRIDSETSSASSHIDVLAKLLTMMDTLEETYPDDWYVRWNKPRVMRNEMGAEAKQKCMRDLKEIYGWTQTYLKYYTADNSRRPPHPSYLNLVAAHAYMAAHACEDAKAFVANDPRIPDAKDRMRVYDIDPDHHGSRFNHQVYEIASHYVKHLHHDQHGIHEYLTNNHTIGITVSADGNEAAWWVMQLRGIVWHLSAWHGETIVRDVLGEQLIPSSFYGNKSPVWIT